MSKRHKGRNKERRLRRKAKRDADNKVNRNIMRTCDRLGLISNIQVIIDDMMKIINRN